jgi:hypothetical protein
MTKTIVDPIRQAMDMKSGLVQLWFDPTKSVAPDGKYRMLGGMWFPSNIKDPETGYNRIVGYAMMMGRHVDSRVTYLFAETEWITVEHILDPDDGAITCEGIVTWLNYIWPRFFAKSFAMRQDDETLFRYQLDFSRCAMVEPTPDFHDAEWSDDAQPISMINREMKLNRLKMGRNTIMVKQLDQYRADDDAERHDYPAVHALKCCMSVLDRYYN